MTAPLRIVVDRARLRRWHVELGSVADAQVSIELREGPGFPSAVETLLTLEKLVLGLPEPRPSDQIQWSGANSGDRDDGITLDLTGREQPGPRTCQICYDGACDEAALLDALFQGHAPRIEIVHSQTGQILAHGLPSVETAENLTEAYEFVITRVSALVRQLVSRALPGLVAGSWSHGEPRPSPSTAQLRYAARTLAWGTARWLYRLCTRSPHWRIGWRLIDGPGVLERGTLDGPAFRNVPSPNVRFFADPFPIAFDGQHWIFFEDFDHRKGKGVISAMPFDREGPVGHARVVLETGWHLSYPFLLEDAGQLWMIPESSADRNLRLYRADRFPDRWIEEAVLLDGVEISDATVIKHEGAWWMFGATRDGGAPSDTLSLFRADALHGPWRPHEQNPVLIDAGAARPAGRMEKRAGRLYRPVQDCRSGYGRALHIAEVTRLSEREFQQEIRATLRPGPNWPGRRLHTLNRSGPLECIDGSAVSLRVPSSSWSAPSIAAGDREPARASETSA